MADSNNFRNRKNFVAFIAQFPNEALEFFKTKTASGKPCLCFSIGETTGYVSSNVASQIDTIEMDDMQYFEAYSESKKEWIPCIGLRNKSNVVRVFKL